MASKGHRDYDVNILASMPVATKPQLKVSGSYQDYDVGLLTSAPTATETQLYKPDPLVEKAVPSTDSAPAERGDQRQPIPPEFPFYRTRKGIIIIIAVALMVVIAVALGGGVAGSKITIHKLGANLRPDSVSNTVFSVTIYGTPTTTITATMTATMTATITATMSTTMSATATVIALD